MIYEKEDLSSSVRFWSDFSRVFFHPRGLLRIPDLPEWERETTWMRGAERFTDFDSVRVGLIVIYGNAEGFLVGSYDTG